MDLEARFTLVRKQLVIAHARACLAKHRFRTSRQRDRRVLKTAFDKAKAGGFVKANASLCLVESARGASRGLVFRTKRSDGVWSKRGLSWDAILEIGKCKIASTSDVARTYGIDNASAWRVRRALANSLLTLNQTVLHKCGEAARAFGSKFCISRKSWDETEQTLTTTVNDLPPHKGSWSVLNSSDAYIFSVAGGPGAAAREMYFEVPRPPTRLLEKTDAAVYDGLVSCKTAQAYTKFEAKALGSADMFAAIFERDGAGANDCVVSKFFSGLPEKALGSDGWCGNHKTAICEASTLAAVQLSLVTALYSAACLLRMGTTYLRLILCIEPALEAAVTRGNVLTVSPPAWCAEYSAELMRYLRWQFRMTWLGKTFKSKKKRAKEHGDAESGVDSLDFSKSVDAYCLVLANFFAVFNSHLHRTLCHCCTSVRCCKNYSTK